jgi:POT family proton-dependent oligopeptide transporter
MVSGGGGARQPAEEPPMQAESPALEVLSPPLVAASVDSSVRERHPPGLAVLFATEMWERFSYYSMLAMFTLYLQDPVQGFGWARDRATRAYALYLACVYLSPLVGGYLADRKLGYRRAVALGGVFFLAGHLLLAVHSATVMIVALTCLVIGNGFFKPNVSAMVGRLYPEGSLLKDRAYNVFYMGINVGAFVAPLVAEVVRSRFGYHVAFAVAGGGMAISVATLTIFRRHLAATEKGGVASARTEEPGRVRAPIELVPERRRVLALLAVFAIVIVFWMAYNQNGATWTYFANDNTDWTASAVVPVLLKVLTLGMLDASNASGVVSNAINPFFVIVLTFPLLGFWSFLARRGREPGTPAKMAIGMLLVALAFVVMGRAGLAGGNVGRVSPWWLIGAYALLSTGELMLSPMGLALVAKVAPERARGFLMGAWFVSISLGGYLVGVIGSYWSVWTHSTFFFVVAALAAALGAFLFTLIKPLGRAMPGV